MRLSYLRSSSVVVEDEGTAVLCDPWLVDGAFHGAWAHYPPLDVEPERYADVDYVYLSGDRPDQFHPPTMARLDADVPVLLHAGAGDRLKRRVEELGFDAVELRDGHRTRLAGDFHVTAVGADGEGTGDRFGSRCRGELPVGGSATARTDSLAVFDDGETVLVNANGCRWPRSEPACEAVVDRYGSVDLLLVQYAAANCYPQRMESYSHEEKLRAREAVIGEAYADAEGFVDALEPAYVVPAAGSYVLAGDLAGLNRYVAAPTRCEAFWHFVGSLEPSDSDPVLLDSGASFDPDEGRPSEEYTPIDRARRREYVEEVLAERSFPYQHDDHPTLAELTDLLGPAYDRMVAERRGPGREGDRTVLLDLVDGKVAALSTAGDGYEVTTADEVDAAVRYSMDSRLLARILRGPEHARFEDALIGSHVGVRRHCGADEGVLQDTMGLLQV